MAVQAPDRLHAWGKFAPVIAPPFTANIVSSKGIAGFTYNSVGNYTITLEAALAFFAGLEAVELPANFLANGGAQLAPDGASVLVTVFDLGGSPVDPPWFGLSLGAIVEGEGEGPAPALPGPPPPPSLGATLYGAIVDGFSPAVANQSQPPWIDTIVNNGVGDNTLTTFPGILDSILDWSVQATPLDSGATIINVSIPGPNTIDVFTFDSTGAPTGGDFWLNIWDIR